MNELLKKVATILFVIFISSRCFGETTKEEDIKNIFGERTDCADFSILNTTYLNNKKLIDSFYVCSLENENKEFIKDISEEKLNARRYSGFVNVQTLRELQYNIVTNNKLIKQFINPLSCQHPAVKTLMSCLDTNYGDSVFKSSAQCEKYLNISILIDYFYYAMGLCQYEVGAPNKYKNCEKDWSFPSIKRPPCK